jgi:hypothetical protein
MKSTEGARAGGKARSTTDRDRELAIEFRHRRKTIKRAVSSTSIKDKIGAEHGMKPETARKAIGRGLRLLDKKTR